MNKREHKEDNQWHPSLLHQTRKRDCLQAVSELVEHGQMMSMKHSSKGFCTLVGPSGRQFKSFMYQLEPRPRWVDVSLHYSLSAVSIIQLTDNFLIGNARSKAMPKSLHCIILSTQKNSSIKCTRTTSWARWMPQKSVESSMYLRRF